nr:RNA-directed DNA polymerase, eukaryota, reverse transcriptase zinc-binding domain protein [Tanacetum cinerariifolium]
MHELAWIGWDKVLSSKKNDGPGVSSFYAFNRALLFKWGWRFLTQESSRWLRFSKAVHGNQGALDSCILSSRGSPWLDIIRDLFSLKSKGIDLMQFMRKIIDNGESTSFWNDPCVASKLKHPTLSHSFRMLPRGGAEEEQVSLLCPRINDVILPNMCDRWIWSLDGSGLFSVKSARRVIDDNLFPKVDVLTRWINVIPIKLVNLEAKSCDGGSLKKLLSTTMLVNLEAKSCDGGSLKKLSPIRRESMGSVGVTAEYGGNAHRRLFVSKEASRAFGRSQTYRDMEVNQAARDSDDALACCVKNMVKDRIIDTDDKTLDIAGVEDVVLKTSFGTSWTLKDVRYIPSLKRRLISVRKLDEEGYHVGFRDQQWKITISSLVVAHGNKRESLYMVEALALHLLHQSEDHATMLLLSKTAVGAAVGRDWMLNMVPETPLQFGVAERLSQTFRAESMGLRVEALKMLWADSVKEYQENDKIRSKPDKNGKRGEAEKSQKQLQGIFLWHREFLELDRLNHDRVFELSYLWRFGAPPPVSGDSPPVFESDPGRIKVVDSDGHLRSCPSGLGGVGEYRRTKSFNRVAVSCRIRVGSWNVGSLTSQLFKLCDSLGRHKVDITYFQDTKWKGSRAREGNGYKLWYSGSSKARNSVGVMVFGRLKDDVVRVTRRSNRIMAISVVIDGESVNVISAYALQVGLSDAMMVLNWGSLKIIYKQQG